VAALLRGEASLRNHLPITILSQHEPYRFSLSVSRFDRQFGVRLPRKITPLPPVDWPDRVAAA
jgi:hypothetical protein